MPASRPSRGRARTAWARPTRRVPGERHCWLPRRAVKQGRRGSVAEYAGASYVPLVLGLVTGPVLARAVGPSGRGDIALVTVFAAILTTLAGLGVPLAIGHSAANKLEDSSRLVATSVRLALW